MTGLFEVDALLALVTLTALEIVLGIDNIIFISILASRLPVEQQPRARTLGLAAAMITRVLLLLSLTWVMKLTAPLFAVFGHAVSGRDLILLGGGLFLLAKSTLEIHHKLEGDDESHGSGRAVAGFAGVIIQIMILDIVFSLDSVITAIGMTENVPVMIIAIVLAVGFMMFAAGAVSRFVDNHPTVKILALSFLILVGVALIGEGLHFHIPKGYIYFAMAFSVAVEMINLRVRKTHQPVRLHGPKAEAE
ncbi:TerC family protein [uncultured Abyssibacter sp.]|uniref:TerC family protein n=1 Tax=uncultured Abyssibacter sp. TaxID=2320202 RepID=UPI0032B1E001